MTKYSLLYISDKGEREPFSAFALLDFYGLKSQVHKIGNADWIKNSLVQTHQSETYFHLKQVF